MPIKESESRGLPGSEGLVASPDYAAWLGELKSRIQSARTRAVLAANQGLVRLYHDIGREILARQAAQGWGAKVIVAWPSTWPRRSPT